MNLNQCYSPGTFFSAPLTLDWGTAFGQANLTNDNPGAAPWATNIAGVNVDISIAGDFSGAGAPQLQRINNEVLVWDGSQWVNAQFSNNPDFHTGFTYGGHFNGPGPAPVAGDGAHLLGLYQGTGSVIITFDQGVSSAGMLVSVRDNAVNSNFDATIKAYDNNSVLLATYVIQTQGVGSECASINTNPPVPCNDAPFLGVKALTGPQIYKIVISATTPLATTSGNPESLVFGSLQFQQFATGAPEPAAIVLCGAGLVLLGSLRRKSKSPKNLQQ